MNEPSGKAAKCSFCGHLKDEVKKLIDGPNVAICNECIDLCIDILDGEAKESGVRLSSYLASIRYLGNPQPAITNGFKNYRLREIEKSCFYLCPFDEPFNTIYSDHVKTSIERLGYKVERADEIFGTQPVIEDIWEGINSSEVIIADVTTRNPNVMYEIGIAHTIGKPVIILTQEINDVPFDLKHHRCIVYAFTPRGCAELEDKIICTLGYLTGVK